MAFGIDQSRAIILAEIVERPDEGRTDRFSGAGQRVESVVMMQRLANFARHHLDYLELGEKVIRHEEPIEQGHHERVLDDRIT